MTGIVKHKNQIHAMWKAGHTTRQIAQKIGVSQSSLQNHIPVWRRLEGLERWPRTPRHLYKPMDQNKLIFGNPPIMDEAWFRKNDERFCSRMMACIQAGTL